MGCFPSVYAITETQQLIVQTFTTEEVVFGPQITAIAPFKTGTKQEGFGLNEKQFIHISNIKTGTKDLVKGPGLIFMKPFERVEGGVKNAIALKPDEYIRILDTKTGEIRIERGEKLIFLLPFDEAFSEGVQKVVPVDATHACLIRDILKGTLILITEPQMFVPTNYQEIVKRSQELIVLKDYEVFVLIDNKGNFVFKHGWVDAESHFFVPPYHTFLELTWTKTSFRKAFSEGSVNSVEAVVEEEKVVKVDVRHRFMPYAFVVRTHDNVEIVLDIVIGWSIANVEKMISKSKDTKNDICLKARSEIIEKVAQLTFRKFMQEVNSIVQDAVLQADKSFYESRGIEMSSIQVEGFSCKNNDTERVLQETVQETTNKMNRIMKQETANEVIRVEMEGKIREEELKKRVLEIQYDHEQLIARTEGEAASKKILSFLESLGDGITLEKKLQLFNVLQKKESIKDLSNGNVTLFCTPEDVNLNMAAFGGLQKQQSKKKITDGT